MYFLYGKNGGSDWMSGLAWVYCGENPQKSVSEQRDKNFQNLSFCGGVGCLVI